MCTRQSPKGNMRYAQYTVPDTVAVETNFFCYFPSRSALTGKSPWPLLSFLQICLKNSEVITTHHTFRGCRVHFIRQPSSLIAVNYQEMSLLKENFLFTTNNNGNNKNAEYSCLRSDAFSIHPRQKKKKANKRNKQLMLMKIDSIFPFVYYFNFVVELTLTFYFS